MRLEPRTVRTLGTVLTAALALTLQYAPGLAQRRRPVRPKAQAQSNNAERARRTLATTLLVETADKARLFDDLFYRARVQALAADVLWQHDERQARAIFRRAWEAAAASDKAEQEEEDARAAGVAAGAAQKVTEARDEVLRRVAARDARLAETFLKELTGEKNEARDARASEERPTAWRELSPAGARRLSLAYEMLDTGNLSRAVELAAPLVNEGPSAGLIAFIVQVGSRDTRSGDALHLRLLERAAADPRTDANAMLLLSTPVISPRLLAVVDEFGSLQFRSIPVARLEAEVTFISHKPFFNLAATVLSRPLPPRDQLTMQELMARFYAIGRLLPHFEENSQPYTAYAPALRARQSELFNEIESGRREQFSSQFSVTTLSRSASEDPLRLPSEQLSQATDAAERERLALSIVRTATRNRFWDRARRAAAEIEDTELRKAALSFIQVHQVKDLSDAFKEEKGDESEGIAKFVRGADVPPFAKAWGLAQAAAIAARNRSAQSSQNVAALINEAESFASRADQGSLERVAAYGLLADAASRLDPPRAWGLLREAVKAANAVEDLTGEEGSLDLAGAAADTLDDSRRFIVEDELFRLDKIFATMARLDFDKTLAEARALDRDIPRALATVAAARTVLEKGDQFSVFSFQFSESGERSSLKTEN